MARLTHDQERRHAHADQLVNLNRDLSEEERLFVLDNWRASKTMRSASDRAFFTPAGLAGQMAIQVQGERIVDLCAGIGRLAFHNRNAGDRWPWVEPEFVCIERNREYVRVGRRVMPEAHWICADVLEIPQMRENLGEFDCAIGNPPFGVIPRAGNAPGGYRGRRFEYHVIALASMIARYGVFLIPQIAAPFQLSGGGGYQRGTGDAEYQTFRAATGIELKGNCGIDTSDFRHDWHDAPPVVEIVVADFYLSEQQGQLALLLR